MNEYTEHTVGSHRYRRYVVRYDDGNVAFTRWVLVD